MKTVAELLARLKELNGELTALMEKDVADDAKADHLAAIDAKVKEIEATEKEHEIAKAAEAARARAAQPATAPLDRPAAEVRTKLDAAEKISIVMAGMVTALTEEGTRGFRPTMKALEDNGYGWLADEFAPAQKRTLNSGSATAGGILLPDTMSNDIIDILRPNTTFLQGGPRVIPMPNGNYRLPAAATGATAAYRGETKPASVTTPTFKGISMTAKLLAGLVPISNQLIRWSGPNVGQWARMDLSNAMGVKLDQKAYFGDGTADEPLGLFNIPGIGSHAASGGTSPTLTQVDADARKLLTPIESYTQLVREVEWRMAPRVFNFLSDMRDSNGNLVFPELRGTNPMWKGYAVRKTTQFPTNLGDNTDESYIGLVSFGRCLYGDTLAMQLSVSDVASAKNGSDTINAFQDSVTLIKAEMEHDIDVEYVEAVQVLTGVRWGA